MEAHSPSGQRSRWYYLFLLAAVAALLRLPWLSHGLPEVTWVDAFKFVGAASRAFESGQHTPLDFQYPPFFQNLLWGLYTLTGADTSFAQHFLARLVSALAGIGMVGATFLLARSAGGSARAAFFAALLAAVSVVSVTYSRIPATDTLLALFVTLSIALAWMGRTPWHSAATGVALGLAVASKWTGVVAFPMVIGAALAVYGEKDRRALVRHLAVSFSAAAVTFVLVCPQFLVNAGQYFTRGLVELQMQGAGQIGRVQGGWLDYLISATPTWESPWLGTSILATDGPLVLAALAFALITAFWTPRDPRRVLLAVAFLGYLLLISGPGDIKAVRFLLPVLPVAYVLVAVAVDDVGRWMRVSPAVAAAFAALLILVPAWRSLEYLVAHRAPPTQEAVADWFEREVPDGTMVFLSPFFTENVVSDRFQILRIPDAGRRQYALPPWLGPSPERSLIFHRGLVQDARAMGTDYVVLNSYFNDAFQPVPENLRFFPQSVEAYRDFHEALMESGRIVFEIEGWSEGRIGPDVTVVALAPGGER